MHLLYICKLRVIHSFLHYCAAVSAAAAASRSRFCFSLRCFFMNLSRLILFTSWVCLSLVARLTPPPHPPAPIFSVVNCEEGSWLVLFPIAPNRSRTVDSDWSTTAVTTKYPATTGREKYTQLITTLPNLPRGERIVFCIQYEWTTFLTRSWPFWNRLSLSPNQLLLVVVFVAFGTAVDVDVDVDGDGDDCGGMFGWFVLGLFLQ